MSGVTILHLSEETHRAPKARATQNGRSTDAEILDILGSTVRPAHRLRIGSALSALSREAGLTNADVEAVEKARNRTPAKRTSFE
ncbi:plasmid stabilization protein [Aureimonas altamirensis]|uniref:FitA-like ribbon-helix-helix domain-containing protein n=1 Tax=Aureimonas altamirensis TaxID=370622 RepID=UPI001E4A865E|nr:plasmid stabilization protein [Aureimonas altamirensis]UHD44060.1 plasmid stabilization protein [Aureimonas altamirensis]